MAICRTLSSGGASVQQLRSQLRTSRRTIFRDLNILDELGIKVDLDDGGYRVRQNSNACRRIIADSQAKKLDKLLNSSLR
jgi:predicted DNA-binding transcriptional regulator YafY